MGTLTEIREALDAALAGIPEEKSISLVGGNYTEGTEEFSIRILAGPPGSEAADRLDALLALDGEGSIVRALESDPTLSGIVSTLAVRKHNGHRVFETPEGEQLGSDVLVELYR